MELPDALDAKRWEGREVLDLSGQPLGRCVGVFADTDTGVAEWLLVDVDDHGRSFVPALDAVEEAERVRLPFPRDLVVAAPSVGDGEQLAKQDERVLYRHYDIPYTDDDSDSLLPVDVPDAAAADVAPVPVDGPRSPVAETVVVRPLGAAAGDQASRTTDGAAGSARPQPVAGGGQPDALAAAGPLAAIGAVVAALWLALRARDARARRRRALPARSRRAGSQVRAVSTSAAHEAAQTLSAAAAAATVAGRRAGKSASAGAQAAERRRQEAATTAARRRGELAKTAGKRRKELSKTAGKRRKELSKTAEQRRKELSKTAEQRRRAATKAARKNRARASGVLGTTTTALGSTTSAASDRTAQLTGAVAAAPGAVTRPVRRALRSVGRTLWRLTTVSAAAGGYVLGARAGRERYDEIAESAAAVAAVPPVRSALETVTDGERRSQALGALQQQVGKVTGRS